MKESTISEKNSIYANFFTELRENCRGLSSLVNDYWGIFPRRAWASRERRTFDVCLQSHSPFSLSLHLSFDNSRARWQKYGLFLSTIGTSLFSYQRLVLTLSCKFFGVKRDDGFSFRLKPIHALYLIATDELHEILQAVRWRSVM